MSLLATLEKAYAKVGKTCGFPPSVVRLCDMHNRGVAQEIRAMMVVPSYTQLDGWCPASTHVQGSRVHTLFDKPVIEETQDGVVKCLLCT
jgi:hypothetical protein